MSNAKRKIELLSPARDLECATEAILHGADAVYIGAPKFGARSAAGNSVDDIRTLCEQAHLYDARVYVTLNTILKDEELKEAEQLIRQLYEAGTDALIIQDMGITRLDIPPIPLHASTQTDNRTPEKVRFLQDCGFTQVVLARELSLEQIRKISEATTVPLEVFVHGALCVSFSGQCYLSAATTGRSANRGECAQCCRLPYTMVDSEGTVIAKDRHLLSLKDMNRTDYLEALMDAGVSSFKIEGRLKDVSYVKNVTAWYREKIDEILARRPEYVRSSAGKSTVSFEPSVEKSFNRGFTSYFMERRTSDITAFDTPKSLGEFVGTVKEVKRNCFAMNANVAISNGDGLAFFDRQKQLEGFRVNKVEGQLVFPYEMPTLTAGMKLYRNYDIEFEKNMSRPTAERKLSVKMTFGEYPLGFTLEMTDETGASITFTQPFEKEPARREQTENIRQQLMKLGNTPFEASDVEVNLSSNWFVPSSLLSEMRRRGVELLLSARRVRYARELSPMKPAVGVYYPEQVMTYLGNVANHEAESFYRDHGVMKIDKAFELSQPADATLMFTKHCLRYSFGWCPVYQKQKSPYKEPYFLQSGTTRLQLHFDCAHCRMTITKE